MLVFNTTLTGVLFVVCCCEQVGKKWGNVKP